MTAPRALQLRGIAYVEMYVANAYQAAFFYRSAFGFTPVAATPGAGASDRQSVLLQQGNIRLMLTGGISARSAVAQHVHEHGDTVRDVAFLVDDVEAAFALATRRGGRAVADPVRTVDEISGNAMSRATIGGPGDSAHSFVQFSQPIGAIWPGFRATGAAPNPGIGLTDVDHVAVGLDPGSLDHWVDFYRSVLGFTQSHSQMIFTPQSGMNSKVVQDDAGVVRIPMLEPSGTTSTSQIGEYLTHHKGAGAQHVAFATTGIATTIETLAERGVRCLSIPETYYTDLETRVPKLDPKERARFASTGVLVDQEEEGVLLQTFTEPLHHRPTLFVELIERRGARGFGARNVQALFEAVERERLRREAVRT